MPEDEANPVRNMILKEATALFLQRGFNGVSMREIAEACRLSKAGLYYHFKDKEDLFLAILNDNLDAVSAVVRQTRAAVQNTRERIIFFAHTLFSQLEVNQRAIIRLASQELRNIKPEAQEGFIKKYHEEFIDAVGSMLEEGMQSGDLKPVNPQTAAWALLGLLYPFLDFAYDEQQHQQMFNDVLNIYFNGIGNPIEIKRGQSPRAAQK